MRCNNLYVRMWLVTRADGSRQVRCKNAYDTRVYVSFHLQQDRYATSDRPLDVQSTLRRRSARRHPIVHPTAVDRRETPPENALKGISRARSRRTCKRERGEHHERSVTTKTPGSPIFTYFIVSHVSLPKVLTTRSSRA